MHKQDGWDGYDGPDEPAAQGEPDAGSVRLDDPWYDALASGWGEPPAATGPPPAWPGAGAAPAASAVRAPAAAPSQAAVPEPLARVYQQVHAGREFQEVRRRYRRFALPATAAFLLWYLTYVVLAVSGSGLMARPVVGAFNVAMVAGIAQFVTTFLLAWAYARHAGRRRDRLALELRWMTQEMAAEMARETEMAPKAARETARERGR